MKSQSIRKRHYNTVIITLIISLLIIVSLISYSLYNQNQLENERDELLEKAEVVEELDKTFNDLLLRARGYYAFLNEAELAGVEQAIADLPAEIEAFDRVADSLEEQQIAEELSEFIVVYEAELFPQARMLAETGQYEELQAFANSGTNTTVNRFLEFTRQFDEETQTELNGIFDRSLQEAILFEQLLASVGVALLIIVIALFTRTLLRVIKPIESLEEVTTSIRDGKPSGIIPFQERKDEIGSLATALAGMTKSLKDSQKDILQKNFLLEDQKESLARMNQLNTALASSHSIDEQVKEVFTFVQSFTGAEKIVLSLVDGSYAKYRGITEEQVALFCDTRVPEIKEVLMTDGMYRSKRDATEAEQTLSEGKLFVEELYFPLMTSRGELLAVLAFAKIGREQTSDEVLTLKSILQRAALAIEAQYSYREIKLSQQLNQDILDNVTEGILFISKDGDLIQFNTAVCEITSCNERVTQDEKQGFKWLPHFLTHIVEKEEVEQFVKQATMGSFDGIDQLTYRVVYATQEKHVSLYAVKVNGGKQREGTLFVHRDITRDFEVNKMKSELVSTVSHELRTPLSSILGFTELLMTRELKKEKADKYLRTIYSESKRLTRLINDFLDLQRMEQGKQEFIMEEVNILTVLRETLDSMEISDKHRIVVDDRAHMTTVKGDREKLRQVLVNLISNAVKYSPEGGLVTIVVTNNKNDLAISVEDEGLGIPAEYVDKLFNKFQRVHNASKYKISGTGLGLAICKEIAQVHHGDISISSEEGKGSIFTFTLPLPLREVGRTISQLDPIFVLEDDYTAAFLLAENLKQHGYRVIHQAKSTDISDVLKGENLKGAVIDLIIDDEVLGWDVITNLQHELGFKDLPIVVTSALEPDVAKIESSGIAGYLTKPYQVEDLVQLLKK
ncbi:response regulator [Paenalkalicoccus suaedae]|uniref:histidine kinase n=1 Tax=Paenalkalicoccus suaedae TaxID=2592382 RepID=A0A859FBG5_9BACI|nr:ATP-binding protein [Paenalkalicoccus suaedae]QKS70377.1 response regulator [Paenalkalicoccus suaedae]